ncbi:MAG: FHA domain-containing protein [Syntrophomonadaceae bacterium]
MNEQLYLEITDGPDQGTRLMLTPGTFFIGRQDSNELCLSDKKVSRVHARITVSANGEATLQDEKSSNGVFLGGQKLSRPLQLFPGETFSMGATTIRLSRDPGASTNQPYQFDFVNPGFTHDLHNAGSYQPSNSSTRSLAVGAKTLNIGRDSSNDVVLRHPLVSRFHARIVSNQSQHVLYDLNSVNGTYVNGMKVAGYTSLQPDSLVQICGFRFIFDGQKLLEYSENDGQVRININHLGRTVALPGGGSKKLLEDLNFTIQPREFVAILGGSGAGKSTLMGALTGMNPANSGEILINGRNLYEEYQIFKSMIGYVPQEDIVHMDLTVDEVLTYSARLRMPDDTTMDEIRNRVGQVLKDLELESRRDVLVRNLSGGQRKRVSIGVELLTSPSIFLLDEPTSGLDPGLEKTMMEMMRRLANHSRTIILVTHATFNIKLCDKVVFLTEGGRLAFFGTPDEALAHFKAADFADIYKKLGDDLPAALARDYTNSQYYRNYLQKAIPGRANALSRHPGQLNAGDRNSPFRQWLVLTGRYTTLLTRDRKNLALLILQPLIIAFLITLVFLNTAPTFQNSKLTQADTDIKQFITQGGVDSNKIDKIQNDHRDEVNRWSKMSMCVAIMVFTVIWLGTTNSAREIVKELPVYRRERRINLHITPYLLSKVIVLGAVGFVQVLVFLAVIQIFLGLPDFWSCVWAFFLITMASIMMGLAISAIASNADKAISLVPLVLVPQIILSGALVRVTTVKSDLLKRLFDLAIAKWGYELMAGGICDINSRVAVYAEEWSNLNGSFTAHWWVLLVFVVVLYAVSSFMMLKKDNKTE